MTNKTNKKRIKSDMAFSSSGEASYDFTKNELEEIIKTAIKTEIADLKKHTAQNGNILECVNTSLSELKEENRQLRQLIKEKDILISAMQTKIDTCLKNTRESEIAVNRLEQYSRKSSVRIYGLQTTNNDYQSAVINLIGTLGITISPADIVAVHPLPKKRLNTDTSPPPIIVKFLRETTKMQIMYVRKNLKNRGTTIKEDLTRLNQQLLNRVAKHERVKSAWSWKGMINCLLNDGKKHTVDPFQELEPLFGRFLENKQGDSHQRSRNVNRTVAQQTVAQDSPIQAATDPLQLLASAAVSGQTRSAGIPLTSTPRPDVHPLSPPTASPVSPDVAPPIQNAQRTLSSPVAMELTTV